VLNADSRRLATAHGMDGMGKRHKPSYKQTVFLCTVLALLRAVCRWCEER
jgi:hypothetical protein